MHIAPSGLQIPPTNICGVNFMWWLGSSHVNCICFSMIQAVENVNSIIGPALIGKVYLCTFFSLFLFMKLHFVFLVFFSLKELDYLLKNKVLVLFNYRTLQSKPNLTISWCNNLTEQWMNGVGANKRYCEVHCSVLNNLVCALYTNLCR